MDDDNLLPDSSITLEPSGNPGDIRPGGPGWTTDTQQDRVVTITVGDSMRGGGVIQLIDTNNVKKYSVEFLKTTQVNFYIS